MQTANPTVRRGIRVVSMIHELHKRGFQKLRALPTLSPSGSYWRCLITYAENSDRAGLPISWDEPSDLVVGYSTGQGTSYFGWSGFENSTARELADHFIKVYPDLTQRGQGRDWEYAGWFVELLGRMESLGDGGLVFFQADFPVDLDSMGICLPPPWRC